MPSPAIHPAVHSGTEELLELAETILFSSSSLPPSIVEKYRRIQAEIKGRVREAVSRDQTQTSIDGISRSPSTPFTESERSIYQEKLAAAKRKNANLQQQLIGLEAQVTQLTNKISALHQHHKTSLVEVQDQTRQACEDSHRRHLQELEARSKLEVSVQRQVMEDQLTSERGFHSNILEKIQALTAMFPDEYAAMSTTKDSSVSETAINALSQALSGGNTNNPHHPNSLSRLQLSTFFELTRKALNESRHTHRELADLKHEIHVWKQQAEVGEDYRYETEKALLNVERKLKEVKREIDGESALRLERNEIIARVEEIERRRIVAQAVAKDVQSIVAPPPAKPPTVSFRSSNLDDSIVSRTGSDVPTGARDDEDDDEQDAIEKARFAEAQAKQQRRWERDNTREHTRQVKHAKAPPAHQITKSPPRPTSVERAPESDDEEDLADQLNEVPHENEAEDENKYDSYDQDYDAKETKERINSGSNSGATRSNERLSQSQTESIEDRVPPLKSTLKKKKGIRRSN